MNFKQALESGVGEKILAKPARPALEIHHYADMPTRHDEQLWVRPPSLHFYMIILNLMIIKTALICARKLLNALVTGDKEASRHWYHRTFLQQNGDD